MAALQYGELTITLAESTDLSKLTDAIRDAVASGGGWLKVGNQGGEQLVFVSAGIPLRITGLAGKPAGSRVIAL